MAVSSFTFPHEIYPDDWFRELNREEIFPDSGHPLEADIGCGDGTFLIEMAKALPGVDFLGVERLLGRCRKVSRKAERAGVENAAVLRVDTNYAVRWLLPKRAFARIHFLCPDPWPKKKHARRRQMCRMDFLRDIRNLLVDGGEFLFKTDSAEYHEEARGVLAGCDFFEELPWEEDAFFYPVTDFEKQWLDEGRTMNRIRLRAV